MQDTDTGSATPGDGYITAAMAKELYRRGHLDTYMLHKGLTTRTWAVEVAEVDRKHRRMLASATAPKVAREFKTLDAAVNALEDMGFSVNVLASVGGIADDCVG
jgi:hypothetical protein